MQKSSNTKSQSEQHLATTICVFCGSGNGHDPDFKTSAEELGRYIADNKYNLVYGGGDMGLMGSVATSARDNGAEVTGVIPRFLLQYQENQNNNKDLIVTETMHERKAQMYQRSDAYIALPGGIGTLEELVETMTWEQLDQHKKPIILLNINHYWQPFLELIKHMKQNHFIRQGLEVNFHVIKSVPELSHILTPSKTTLI